VRVVHLERSTCHAISSPLSPSVIPEVSPRCTDAAADHRDPPRGVLRHDRPPLNTTPSSVERQLTHLLAWHRRCAKSSRRSTGRTAARSASSSCTSPTWSSRTGSGENPAPYTYTRTPHTPTHSHTHTLTHSHTHHDRRQVHAHPRHGAAELDQASQNPKPCTLNPEP